MPIKITDLRCAIIGQNPIVRIVTDEGVSGYGQAESYKPYLKPMVLFYKDYLLGEDPTDVERVMLKIRQRARSSRGAARSARSRWRSGTSRARRPACRSTSCSAARCATACASTTARVRFPMTGHTPQDYAENMAKMKAAKEGFTIIKQAIGFHKPAMMRASARTSGTANRRTGAVALRSRPADRARPGTRHRLRRGDEGGARRRDRAGARLRPRLDGAGRDPFARALEPLNIMWLEDLITGDYIAVSERRSSIAR